jgi:hypothetical protein
MKTVRLRGFDWQQWLEPLFEWRVSPLLAKSGRFDTTDIFSTFVTPQVSRA